ncbi:hypothetical protein GCM10011391_12380 [Pullulanibacillus camelliae]|uniref:DUF5105 domain-containing protein n=1 Tax=Pullulanibacillus camelliae TaxID=1707096 RepID=A0A8J2YDU0_9BACL|nr:hypothetical protein [Pullulanibacillus camelliae]GGE35188.1 hypothetical protein GCM10011391_12380 [Pullulanibacillus camelliae]
MNKVVKGLLIGAISIFVLTGCTFGPKPTDTVSKFLKDVQKSDLKGASTLVQHSKDDVLNSFTDSKDSKDAIDANTLFKAITKGYTFEKPTLVSQNGDTAKVKVKITSVDVATAMGKAMEASFKNAFANAFSEDQKQADKDNQAFMEKEFLKNLNAKDAKMSTRTETLSLKKDKHGDWKLVSDKALENTVEANASKLDQLSQTQQPN